MVDLIEEKPASRRAGRPRGALGKPRQQALFDRLMSQNKNEIKRIIENTIKLAESGESWAVVALLDRMFPKPSKRTVAFRVPEIRNAEDGQAAVSAILAACGAGALTPDEAKTLTDIVFKKVEVAHKAEVEARLARVEAQQSGKELTFRRVS